MLSEKEIPIEERLPLAVLLYIQLQLKLVELRNSSKDTRAEDEYQHYIQMTMLRLKIHYEFTEQEIEWMDEMVLPDIPVLETLEQRMIEKIRIEDNIHAAQSLVAHILYILLDIKGNNPVEYDARLRTGLKSMAMKIMDYDSKSLKMKEPNDQSYLDEATVESSDKCDDKQKKAPFILFLAECEVIKKIAEINSSLSEAAPSKEEESDSKRLSRWAGVGLAAVGGGLLIGVTGGLATPLIAAGLGTLGTSLGVAGAAASFTALGSVTGAAIVGTLFGVSGAGLAGYKINRRLKDLEEFFFTPINDVPPGLSYYIAISGWLTDINDSTNQWAHLSDWNPMVEILTLSFDRQSLVDLTTAASEFIKTSLITYGASGIAAVTAASTLAFALGWPVALLQTAAMLDNPWNMALDKAEQAGRHLARSVLATHVGGKRPVTLIGHGMGARVIVYCLLELYAMTDIECDIYSMIDSVYLFGAVASLGVEEWSNIRNIVAGRFVNCYSKNDWFLQLLYRLHPNPAAGFAPIEVDNVENIDASEMIQSHGDYASKLEELLTHIKFEE